MDFSCETQIRLGGPNSLLMICLEPTDGVLRHAALPACTGCQQLLVANIRKDLRTSMMSACTSCQHINTTNFSRSNSVVYTVSCQRRTGIFNTLPNGEKEARSVNRDPLIPL